MTDRIVVTGAGGYVGGRVVNHLVGDGRAVDALSLVPAPWLPVPVRRFDLAENSEDLERSLEGADAVIHLAGTNEAAAAHDPELSLTSTIVAARRVAETCAAMGVKRVVYVSTMHIYGAALTPGAAISEETVPQPRTVYAIARLASEHVLASAGVEVVVIRLTNGVGAPVAPEVDRWSLVVNDLCRQAVTTGTLRLRSDGLQWRDFVWLGDLCKVLTAATDPSRVPAGTYNLSSGRPSTVRALAEQVQDAVAEATGERPPLEAPAADGEPPAPYTVSAERLAALGLRAEAPVRTAIDETVRFCLEHRNELRTAAE